MLNGVEIELDFKIFSAFSKLSHISAHSADFLCNVKEISSRKLENDIATMNNVKVERLDFLFTAQRDFNLFTPL